MFAGGQALECSASHVTSALLTAALYAVLVFFMITFTSFSMTFDSFDVGS